MQKIGTAGKKTNKKKGSIAYTFHPHLNREKDKWDNDQPEGSGAGQEVSQQAQTKSFSYNSDHLEAQQQVILYICVSQRKFASLMQHHEPHPWASAT